MPPPSPPLPAASRKNAHNPLRIATSCRHRGSQGSKAKYQCRALPRCTVQRRASTIRWRGSLPDGTNAEPDSQNTRPHQGRRLDNCMLGTVLVSHEMIISIAHTHGHLLFALHLDSPSVVRGSAGFGALLHVACMHASWLVVALPASGRVGERWFHMSDVVV